MKTAVRYDKSQKYNPWYVRLDGRKRYFKTEGEAEKALARYDSSQPKMVLTARDLADWRAAKAMLPPGTLLAYVAKQFLATNRTDWKRTVSTSIDDYMLAREAEPGLRPRYLARLRRVTKWIKEEIGDRPLASLSYGDIEKICTARGKAHAQHEARTYLSIFFNYCIRHQWIDRNFADGKIVTLGKLPRPTVEFMPVPLARKMIEGAWNHAVELVVPMAIQMFAGVRTEEVTRLDWAQVQLGTHIDIKPEVSKVGERRVIDWWPENLTTWLEPLKRKTGLVAPTNYGVRRAMLINKLKVELPHNAFRHSYATYGVALHQDAKRISLMLGHHDSDLIFKHYRGYATKEAAESYFAISR